MTQTTLRGLLPASPPGAPDGMQAYVACLRNLAGPGTVRPIATATNTAGKPIMVGAGPSALVIAR